MGQTLLPLSRQTIVIGGLEQSTYMEWRVGRYVLQSRYSCVRFAFSNLCVDMRLRIGMLQSLECVVTKR